MEQTRTCRSFLWTTPRDVVSTQPCHQRRCCLLLLAFFLYCSVLFTCELRCRLFLDDSVSPLFALHFLGFLVKADRRGCYMYQDDLTTKAKKQGAGHAEAAMASCTCCVCRNKILELLPALWHLRLKSRDLRSATGLHPHLHLTSPVELERRQPGVDGHGHWPH